MDTQSEPSPCRARLQAAGLTPVGSGEFCALAQRDDPVRHYCISQPNPYTPVQVGACQKTVNGSIVETRYFPSSQLIKNCMALNQQDPAWDMGWVYCCCSAPTGSAPDVGVPGGTARADEVPPGGHVMAGTLVREGGAVRVEWRAAEVGLSAGVELDGGADLLRVELDGGRRPMLVADDQLFVRVDGGFVRACALAAGDRLLGSDGGAVAVAAVRRAAVRGALHHVATAAPWTGTPNGHLLDLGGVVAADYLAQLRLGDPPR